MSCYRTLWACVCVFVCVTKPNTQTVETLHFTVNVTHISDIFSLVFLFHFIFVLLSSSVSFIVPYGDLFRYKWCIQLMLMQVKYTDLTDLTERYFLYLFYVGFVWMHLSQFTLLNGMQMKIIVSFWECSTQFREININSGFYDDLF